MSSVYDVEDHVGGIGAVGEIAYFVDDQDRWRVYVDSACTNCPARKVLGRTSLRDRRGGKARVEAVLNRSVGNGDCRMGFARPGLIREDQRAALWSKNRPRRPIPAS
jgi:hypothetical protein